MKKGFIFVSHSSKDRGKANEAVQFLEKAGYACWIAPRDIDAGSDYPSQITGAIRGCAALLLIMSGNANASEPVSSEVSLAYSFRKEVVALRIEDVPFSGGLEEFFGRPMYRVHRINAFADFEKGLNALSALFSALRIEHIGGSSEYAPEGEEEESALPVDAESDLNSYNRKDYKIVETCLIRCEGTKRGTAVVPSGVTIIWEEAFSNCKELVKIVLPPTVMMIDDKAFYYCSKAKEIVLPPTLKTIGREAFYGCNHLTNLVLPDSLCQIGANAFTYCTVPKNLKLPAGLKHIAWSAFEHCLRLEKVLIPDNVKHIGMGAFMECESLTELRLPNKLKRISAYTFSGCNSLLEVNIPANVKKIGICAFWGCESLERVDLPNGLKRISWRAFSLNKNLKELTIPPSVKHISRKAFDWCSGLTRVTLPVRFKKKCKRIFGVITEKIEFIFI